jgi:hypothetical protein
MRRFLLICSLVIVSTSSPAQSRCMVTDPTGTPLNVRSRPNGGSIVGALHNGTSVRVMDREIDERGRTWSYVVPAQGKAGWIYRHFISCY